MTEIAIIVLLTAWLLGTLSSYTLGGAIHLCLLLAAILAMYRWSRRRGTDRRVF